MGNELTKQENTTVQQPQITASERFTNMVMKEFQGNIGELNINEYQRQLIKGYFIGIDNALKKAEEARVNKNSWKSTKEEDKNDLAVIWQNVNMNDLAIAVVHHAKLGLDMQLPNHLNAIPYKNSKTNKYDIGFLKGYRGLEYIATQLSLYPIKNITVELIYSNDLFEIINRDNITKYSFTIKNPFNRGEIIGGFGYIQYVDETKNKIVVLSKQDIDKRKPTYAAAEFWGGEKDKWENGKKIGKEKVEGWYEEMARKTVARATYNAVSIDPKKVNESYAYVVNTNENYYIGNQEDKVQEEIEEKANKELIDITPEGPKQENTSEPVPEEEPKTAAEGPAF